MSASIYCRWAGILHRPICVYWRSRLFRSGRGHGRRKRSDESCMPAGCSPACPFRVMARFRYGSVRNFSSKRGRELPAGTLPRHRNSSQRAEKSSAGKRTMLFHHEVGFPTHRQPCEVAEHKIPVGSVRSHADNAFVASRAFTLTLHPARFRMRPQKFIFTCGSDAMTLRVYRFPCSSSSPLRELRR